MGNKRNPGMPRVVPGYAKKNISCDLPEYTNAEQDRVRLAFGSGNYNSIKVEKKLELSKTTEEKNHQENVNSMAGVFHAFSYESSPYSLEDKMLKEEFLKDKKKIRRITPKI
eukprot:TRINITY_DN461_c0_g3_i2.p1 TRINITY_DN461_c0_g3~~TRINITY_DN461_c0_g3_i2.p1  ORF type:complete len:112 (-),score=22.94 TRINITY_DN461_c0_g3_i2:776-1111(-)